MRLGWSTHGLETWDADVEGFRWTLLSGRLTNNTLQVSWGVISHRFPASLLRFPKADIVAWDPRSSSMDELACKVLLRKIVISDHSIF